MDDSHDRRYRK